MNVRIFDSEYKLILIIYIFNKDKLFFNKKFKIYILFMIIYQLF